METRHPDVHRKKKGCSNSFETFSNPDPMKPKSTKSYLIPQESVVIPTFFILKINKIVAKLPNDNSFQISLYMDALQIS